MSNQAFPGRAVVVAMAAVLVVSGCAGARIGRPREAMPRERQRQAPPPPPAEAPVVPLRIENWEAFTNTSRALGREISEGAHALRAAGPGARPADLASLRMTAEARDLIRAGNVERARDLLDRALELDGRNGFAYLYLAYANHLSGRFDQAASFAERAGRYLPRDPYVRGELEGLSKTVRLNASGRTDL